jgi:hypothetical protein
MTLTPRQVWAYLEFSNKLERSERAVAFLLSAHAAQSDSKTIEKTLKDISNGGEV